MPCGDEIQSRIGPAEAAAVKHADKALPSHEGSCTCALRVIQMDLSGAGRIV